MEEHEKHSVTGHKSPYSELCAKLVIAAALLALTLLLKSAYPAAAEAVSSLLLGDGSFREAFARIADGSAGVEAFMNIVGGEAHEAEG